MEMFKWITRQAYVEKNKLQLFIIIRLNVMAFCFSRLLRLFLLF